MAFPKITIRGLRALVAVYEEQSFSRAAARENATQSGMSTQVKNLETTLDTPLLMRGKGALDLTPAGRVVYERGRDILLALSDLEARVREIDGAVTGQIRLGIIPTLTRSVLPKVMHSFRADFPEVDLSILEEYSNSLMRRVVQNDLDCAIVPAGDLLPGLAAQPVASDYEVLVARAGAFAFAGKPHLSTFVPGDLDGVKLIMPSPINVRRQWLDRYLRTHGVRPGGILEMDAMLATLEIVADSDWCAILPSVLLHPDLGGAVRELHPLDAPPIRTDYVAVQKAEKAPTLAARLFVERLRVGAREIREDWDSHVRERA